MAELIADNPILFFALCFVIVYMGSCMLKPFRVCKACRRTRESHSKLFKGAFGACRSCNGRGHHLRLGARLLGKKL